MKIKTDSFNLCKRAVLVCECTYYWLGVCMCLCDWLVERKKPEGNFCKRKIKPNVYFFGRISFARLFFCSYCSSLFIWYFTFSLQWHTFDDSLQRQCTSFWNAHILHKYTKQSLILCARIFFVEFSVFICSLPPILLFSLFRLRSNLL